MRIQTDTVILTVTDLDTEIQSREEKAKVNEEVRMAK